MPWPIQLSDPITGLLEALLIGLIVGIQRESAQDEQQPGLRDFLLIALAGGVCGLVGQPWLTTAALIGISGLVGVFHWKAELRTGITTELTAVTTFCVCVLATDSSVVAGSRVAIAAAILMVAFLEAKRSLSRFFRETITDTEFNDTIWFLAIVFIIYPLLPEQPFGPNDAIALRTIWVFVILVSSISYVGYFLQKFLGERQGLFWTSILGGLASTTASTLSFSRRVSETPEKIGTYWFAVVVANAIQFPRVAILLFIFNPGLADQGVVVFLAMMGAGLFLGWLLYRRSPDSGARKADSVGNPFRLIPALKFGILFAVILFISKAATAEFGGSGLYWASAIGGTIDADAVLVSVAELQSGGAVSVETALVVLLLALLMNGVLKTCLAFYVAGASFGWRVATGFLVMFGAGAAALLAMGYL